MWGEHPIDGLARGCMMEPMKILTGTVYEMTREGERNNFGRIEFKAIN
jgi:hypothetical protein